MDPLDQWYLKRLEDLPRLFRFRILQRFLKVLWVLWIWNSFKMLHIFIWKYRRLNASSDRWDFQGNSMDPADLGMNYRQLPLMNVKLKGTMIKSKSHWNKIKRTWVNAKLYNAIGTWDEQYQKYYSFRHFIKYSCSLCSFISNSEVGNDKKKPASFLSPI